MAATAATAAPTISSVRPPAWTVSCRSADRLLARPTSAGIVGGLLGSIGPFRLLRHITVAPGLGNPADTADTAREIARATATTAGVSAAGCRFPDCATTDSAATTRRLFTTGAATEVIGSRCPQ